MKRSLLLGLAVLTVSLSANAYDLSFSDINPLFNYATNTQSSNVTAEAIAVNATDTLTNLDSQLLSTDNAVKNSFLTLVSLLSSQKEAQTLKSKLSAITDNTTTTKAAKSTAVNQLMNTYASSLVTNKAAAIKNISNLSATDKSILVNTLSSLMQNEYNYLNIAGEYTKAAANAARVSQNMTNVSNNLLTAKETAMSIRNNAAAVKNVVTQAAELAKACGLTVNM